MIVNRILPSTMEPIGPDNVTEGSTALMNWTIATTPGVIVHHHVDHDFIARYISVTLSILGIIGTSTVLLALGKLRGKFSPHLLLVVNLTISDLMVCLLVIANRLDHDMLNNVAYNIVRSNGCYRNIVYGKGFRICTFLHLLAMAMDHYIAIVRPMSYRRFVTRRKTIVLIMLIWVISGVLHFTQFYATLSYLDPEVAFCITYAKIRKSLPLIQYIYICMIAVGTILMMYVYIRVFHEARKCLQYTPQLRESRAKHIKQDWYAAITSLLILGTFLLCYLPYTFSQTLKHIPALKHHLHHLHAVHPYMASLRVLNSVCDPVIYALRLSKVREGLRSVRRCVCSRQLPRREDVPMVNMSSGDYDNTATRQTEM